MLAVRSVKRLDKCDSKECNKCQKSRVLTSAEDHQPIKPAWAD